MRRTTVPLLLTLLVALACQQEAPPPEETAPPGPARGTPEWKIQNALSAGPVAVTANAAVMDWPATEGGQMTELRPGTNGWVCMPDAPSSPGTDPMCLDQAFLAWAAAWQSKTAPKVATVGFGYMLQGGSDASNTDPYATAPDSGAAWVDTGPHVMMVFPDPRVLRGMNTDHKNGLPYVMWQGTPYAHVMMPVK